MRVDLAAMNNAPINDESELRASFTQMFPRNCDDGHWVLAASLMLAVLGLGVYVPIAALANPIPHPVSVAAVVVKDQTRFVPELEPVAVPFTRDDAIPVIVVPTISYRGDHYEKQERPSAKQKEKDRIDSSRPQKRSAVDGYRLASLAPVDEEQAHEPRLALDDAVEIELPPMPRGRSEGEDDPLKALASARDYVATTSTPGGTMSRQGRDKAVECLHPEFVLRIAAAIREARTRGLSNAGLFSACRPPAFGVGGFRDKFNSLHAYGLAVDVFGIGRPGSAETKHWHSIARRNGVVCPYGPYNRAEFNHCQPTNLRVITRANPLRSTITAQGPIDLERMWNAAKALIVSVAAAVSGETQAAKHAPQMRASRVAARSKASRRYVRYARR